MKKFLILLGFMWGGGLIVVGGSLPAFGQPYHYFIQTNSTLAHENQQIS